MTSRSLHILWTTVLLVACAGCAPRESVTLRVMSYNIRHAEGMDGRVDLMRIAEVIRRESPDLVALQEVDRGVQRSGREDQPAELGRLTGMESVFEKNIPYQGGEYGNAVLSRLPVISHRNHYLPKSLPNEQRGMLEVLVNAGGHRVRFYATHFDYHPGDGERLASVQMFRELVEPYLTAPDPAASVEPVILAGDLNAMPESAVLKRLLDFMLDSAALSPAEAFTFPADRPNRRIDYILYNAGSGLTCLDFRVIDEPMASDHRPVVATFTLSNASGGGN